MTYVVFKVMCMFGSCQICNDLRKKKDKEPIFSSSVLKYVVNCFVTIFYIPLI